MQQPEEAFAIGLFRDQRTFLLDEPDHLGRGEAGSSSLITAPEETVALSGEKAPPPPVGKLGRPLPGSGSTPNAYRGIRDGRIGAAARQAWRRTTCAGFIYQARWTNTHMLLL